jgi:Flp pilus assembly protein TadG
MRRVRRMSSQRGPLSSEKGSAIIEFALSFSLLFLIFSGLYQYGYFCWIYNGLEASVRDAAALAARLDYDGYGNGANFTTSLKNMVVFGSPDGGTTPVVPNLKTANVNITVKKDSAGIPNAVTVAIANFKVDTVFKTSTINKPVVTTQYFGGYKIQP